MAWSGSGVTMRSSFWLLISLPVALAAAAQSPPPARVEIHYELMRNGSAMAEVSNAPSVMRVLATGAIALTVTP